MNIEVIYGPSSTLYDQDTINAVINVITQKPTPELSGQAVGVIGTKDHKEGYFSLGKDFKTKAGPAKVSTFIQYQDTDLHDFGKTFPDWWSAGETVAAQGGEGDPPERRDEGLNAFFRMETENASLQVWHRESSRSSSEGGFLPILYYVDKAVWHDESSVIEGRDNQYALKGVVTPTPQEDIKITGGLAMRF